MTKDKIRIMVSRHSAFYSPLLSTIAAGFLREEGFESSYEVLTPGSDAQELIRSGEIDIVQSAVSSSWARMEKNEGALAAHFAQINQRDGFFLTGRSPDRAFNWKKLEGASLLAATGHAQVRRPLERRRLEQDQSDRFRRRGGDRRRLPQRPG